MKENKGKWLVDEETLLETQSQPHPSAGDKINSLSKMIDLGNIPNRWRNKKAKHKLSKPRVVQPDPVILPASQQLSIQIHDLDSSVPAGVTPSKPVLTTSS